jgi:hypothetical protein
MRTVGYFPEIELPELEASPHLPPLSVKSYDFWFTTCMGSTVVTTALQVLVVRFANIVYNLEAVSLDAIAPVPVCRESGFRRCS